jgi:hypothetical protein
MIRSTVFVNIRQTESFTQWINDEMEIDSQSESLTGNDISSQCSNWNNLYAEIGVTI